MWYNRIEVVDMQEALKRLASGHIMRLVTEAKGVHARNLDGIVAQVITQLRAVDGAIGASTIVVQELQRLMQRGRLVWTLNSFNNLVLEPREEVLRTISPIR